MTAPTEPGWYWWRHPGSILQELRDWHPRRIIQRADGTLGILFFLACNYKDGTSPFDFVQGEWGPRIPGPDQLEAMREVCNRNPLWRGVCYFCGNSDDTHAPHCAYGRAQDKPKE